MGFLIALIWCCFFLGRIDLIQVNGLIDWFLLLVLITFGVFTLPETKMGPENQSFQYEIFEFWMA